MEISPLTRTRSRQGGLLAEPLPYLNLYFKQHRAVYYKLPDRVRGDGDWEAWVGFFLEGVSKPPTASYRLPGDW